MLKNSTNHATSRSRVIIVLGFSTILVLVTMLISAGISTLNTSKSRLDKVVNLNTRKIQLVNHMRSSARERTINLQHMMVINDPDVFEHTIARMAFHGGQFAEARQSLLKLSLSQSEEELLRQQARLSQHIGPLQNQIADLANFGEIEKAKALLIKEAIPLQDNVFKVLSKLQNIQNTEMKQAISDSSLNYTRIVSKMWIVASIVMLIGASIVFFILRLLKRNQEKEINYRQDIEKQAFYDHLTGLPNRRLLHDRLKHAMAQAKRKELLIAILFIDCDRFKPINDSLGHAIGDSLLISIAERLNENVRNSDTVCRYSGDEFCVLLENVDHISVVDRIAQNIIDSIASPHFIEKHKIFTSVSIGISVYPLEHKDIDELLTLADIAMYHAKQNGGGQYEYYDTEMNAQSKKRLALELDLHDAQEKNQLELYYQPQNSITDNQSITGVEALLRWHHPQRGMVLPIEFIGLAEDTGLIVPIGEWIMQVACAQLKSWEQQGLKKINVSVNLSPRQFNDANLFEYVTQAISQSGIHPSQLDLEITESTAMHNIETTIEILHKLKELGVNISIDDFGTGYSSLSYLQKMPIDKLKIDRSFTKNLHHSTKDKAFVQAIITMAHTLGIKTVAEGIEQEEQLNFLKEVDCDIVQGYLFSPPVPAEQFAELIKSSR